MFSYIFHNKRGSKYSPVLGRIFLAVLDELCLKVRARIVNLEKLVLLRISRFQEMLIVCKILPPRETDFYWRFYSDFLIYHICQTLQLSRELLQKNTINDGICATWPQIYCNLVESA